MWETAVDGRPLHFRLWGINNQNFIMRDEETGSWWQQVTGEAIHGPLKGRRLTQVAHDELTFSLWKQEQARGRVLRPDPQIVAAGRYAKADWETRMAGTAVVTRLTDRRLQPRDLVIGVTVNGVAKAYPLATVQAQSPLMDVIGGVPIAVIVGDDRRSVRAFVRKVDGRELEFFAVAGETPLRLADAQTGSEWTFAGVAVSGPMAGRQLEKLFVLNDYWFDWKIYNPDAELYRR